MMMALAAHARPAVRARARRRDAAAARTARTRARCSRSARASRTARSRSSEAAELGCRACASPGGGCQFLGTAATSQVVGEALGLSLPHARWRPPASRSGSTWRAARRGRSCASTRAACATRDILTDAAVRNAMTVHAAFGGSTNLLLHLPAVAHAAGLRRPTVEDWTRGQPPRAAPGRRAAQRPRRPPDGARVPGRRRARGDAAPAARRRCSTSDACTVTGEPLGRVLDWWEGSERRRALRERLRARGRRRSRRRDHGPRAGATARAHQHGDLPARQPRAGGLGHQEHGHRPDRGRRRRRLSQDGPGARLHARARGDRRHQEPRRGPRSSRATCWC